MVVELEILLNIISHYDEFCILVSYFYSYSVFLVSYQLSFLVRGKFLRRLLSSLIFSNLSFPMVHGLDHKILKFIRK